MKADDPSAKSGFERRFIFDYVVRTDVGMRRDENQDSYGLAQTENASLFVVADGMGGAAGGARASFSAVNLITRLSLDNRGLLTPETVREAVRISNEFIFKESNEVEGLAGMGTTLVVLGLVGDRAIVCNVGDSRIYLKRNSEIIQLTRDHTLVQDLVESGAITPDQAENHPIAHMLTRSLGPTASIEADIDYLDYAVEEGDQFLLCCDGLYNHVTDEEMLDVLSSFDPGDAVERLVLLANSRGGTDNITIEVVSVMDVAKKNGKVAFPVGKIIELATSGDTKDFDPGVFEHAFDEKVIDIYDRFTSEVVPDATVKISDSSSDIEIKPSVMSDGSDAFDSIILGVGKSEKPVRGSSRLGSQRAKVSTSLADAVESESKPKKKIGKLTETIAAANSAANSYEALEPEIAAVVMAEKPGNSRFSLVSALAGLGVVSLGVVGAVVLVGQDGSKVVNSIFQPTASEPAASAGSKLSLLSPAEEKMLSPYQVARVLGDDLASPDLSEPKFDEGVSAVLQSTEELLSPMDILGDGEVFPQGLENEKVRLAEEARIMAAEKLRLEEASKRLQQQKLAQEQTQIELEAAKEAVRLAEEAKKQELIRQKRLAEQEQLRKIARSEEIKKRASQDAKQKPLTLAAIGKTGTGSSKEPLKKQSIEPNKKIDWERDKKLVKKVKQKPVVEQPKKSEPRTATVVLSSSEKNKIAIRKRRLREEIAIIDGKLDAFRIRSSTELRKKQQDLEEQVAIVNDAIKQTSANLRSAKKRRKDWVAREKKFNQSADGVSLAEQVAKTSGEVDALKSALQVASLRYSEASEANMLDSGAANQMIKLGKEVNAKKAALRSGIKKAVLTNIKQSEFDISEYGILLEDLGRRKKRLNRQIGLTKSVSASSKTSRVKQQDKLFDERKKLREQLNKHSAQLSDAVEDDLRRNRILKSHGIK